MKWRIHQHGEDISYTGEAAHEAAETVFSQLCQHFFEHGAERNRPEDWDYLKAEIWADSGRLMMFVAKSSSRFRTDRCVVQIVWLPLLDQWESLCDSDLRDDKFGSECAALISRVARQVSEVAATQAVNFPEVRGKVLRIHNADATEALVETTL